MTTGVYEGPSGAARARMNRVLLCLVDANCGLGIRETIDRLSEPMSRADADAAFKRLLGAEQIAPVMGTRPLKFAHTTKGYQIAERLVARGDRY